MNPYRRHPAQPPGQPAAIVLLALTLLLCFAAAATLGGRASFAPAVPAAGLSL